MPTISISISEHFLPQLYSEMHSKKIKNKSQFFEELLRLGLAEWQKQKQGEAQ